MAVGQESFEDAFKAVSTMFILGVRLGLGKHYVHKGLTVSIAGIRVRRTRRDDRTMYHTNCYI